MKIKECLGNKVLNPKTNRCVLRNGLIGKNILAKNNCKDIFIDWSNNSCYIDSLLVAFFTPLHI